VKTMFDAAYPQPAASVQHFDVAGGYLGFPGATPHVWSDSDWASQPCRYRFPIMVPSWFRFGTWDAVADANAAAAQLASIGADSGCLIGLDMETQIVPTYVGAFISTMMNQFGHPVAVYGSTSTLFSNRADQWAGGYYWPADITDQPVLLNSARASDLRASGQNVPDAAVQSIVATQYAGGSALDLNVILDSVPLWDTQKGSFVTLLIPASISQRWPDQAPAFPPNTPYTDDSAIIWTDAGAREAADKANAAVAGLNVVQGAMAALSGKVDGIAAQIAAGVPVSTGPTSLSIADADVQRIAVAVARLLGKDLSV
jgi:hypothetical protein